MKYFKIDEFTQSPTARARHIDNSAPEAVVKNIHRLVETVLDPLREAWGKPLIITSGYRCPELNAAIRGSKTSAHMSGRAADIGVHGNNIKQLAKLIVSNNLPYDQIISEYGSWLHIGIAEEGKTPRKQKLIINKSTGGVYQTWYF